MIKDFKHKGLKKLFQDGKAHGISPKHRENTLDVLDRLHGANDLRDMSYPGSGLHLLKPKADKIYAVSVSGAWRITFRFENGDAYAVDYQQYH